jgi:serine/threonine protein kinase
VAPSFRLEFETTFGSYSATEVLGEGGAGRVYAGQSDDGRDVAIKVLTQTTGDKRKRFSNEIAFLSKGVSPRLVTVIDHGLLNTPRLRGPFYVMPRYASSLRAVIGKVRPEDAFALFQQLLDGVEAAHLMNVFHRDLKPENVLLEASGKHLVVADSGIAHFTEELLVTAVATGLADRLANFQYAAPEQRTKGRSVDHRADLYSLGLMLNELFTGEVPHGTQYKLVGSAAPSFSFLDSIVSQLLSNAPNDRPASIAAVKTLIERHRTEGVSQQRLDELKRVVVPASEVVDPLAGNAPSIINVDWQLEPGARSGVLTLFFDVPIPEGWRAALLNMGGHEAVWGKGPEQFRFSGDRAHIGAEPQDVQRIVDHFKRWIPRATEVYQRKLAQAARQLEANRIAELQAQRIAEEKRLEVLRNLRL